MQYTLQTVNNDGKILNESKLELTPHSILIQKMPDFIKIETVQRYHDYLTNCLTHDCKVITIPEDIKLEILEIKE